MFIKILDAVHRHHRYVGMTNMDQLYSSTNHNWTSDFPNAFVPHRLCSS